MTEMIRRYMAQKLGSLGVCLALLLLAILSAMMLQAGRPGPTLFVVFVLAGGLVSRDAASGALQMILSRPILRVEYLLGRYFGVMIALAGFLAFTFLLAVGFDRVAQLAGLSGQSSFSAGTALARSVEQLPRGALDAAILLFFSTFLRGFGDILAFVIGSVVLNIVPQVAMGLQKPGLVRFFQAANANLSPEPEWDQVVHGALLQPAAGRYALALAGYFLLATLIFNRREFSYGTD